MVLLWDGEVSPGESSAAIIVPGAGFELWSSLDLPTELGMFEGNKQIGRCEVRNGYRLVKVSRRPS